MFTFMCGLAYVTCLCNSRTFMLKESASSGEEIWSGSDFDEDLLNMMDLLDIDVSDWRDEDFDNTN